MASNTGIPQGMRDFTPAEMTKRNYIFDTIRKVFKLYGYQPIETPTLENLSTLLGKYGDEGDKLLFRVLNSGDFLNKVPENYLENPKSEELVKHISDKGLRYDLTVPFARFVVQHRNEIVFPFKRYQIQPVWRADRPQKGRYREFYQCDVDIVGSDSLIYEVEMIKMLDMVFKNLSINVKILINNRKILSGIAEVTGEQENIIPITVAIDKIDKIGIDNVIAELKTKGISEKAIDILQPILHFSGTTSEKIEMISSILKDSEVGMLGIKELRTVFDYLKEIPTKAEVEFDMTLARGLNYYTGAILEVKSLDVSIGSISGGGRYDDLTGIFGLKDVSGVGVSFGADRIYDVMNELNLFPQLPDASSKVMIVNFGEKAELKSLKVLQTLHENNISAEIYPEPAKMKKQFNYANSKNIPFIIIIGDNELQTNTIQLKNMNSGEQISSDLDNIINTLNNK